MHNIRFIEYTYTYNIFIATYIVFRQKLVTSNQYFFVKTVKEKLNCSPQISLSNYFLPSVRHIRVTCRSAPGAAGVKYLRWEGLSCQSQLSYRPLTRPVRETQKLLE